VVDIDIAIVYIITMATIPRKVPKQISVEEKLLELCELHSNDFPVKVGRRYTSASRYLRCAAKERLLRDYPSLGNLQDIDWTELDP